MLVIILPTYRGVGATGASQALALVDFQTDVQRIS